MKLSDILHKLECEHLTRKRKARLKRLAMETVNDPKMPERAAAKIIKRKEIAGLR
jgi:hypothetical protein